MRCRGFLIGGTAGRTTLAGEGLQHQDGHSHVLALPVPNLHGLRSRLRLRDRRHHSGWHQAHVRRRRIHLLLLDGHQRAAAACPRCPASRAFARASSKGLYRYQTSEKKDAKLRAQLLGSGTIMFEVLKAQEILEKNYGVAVDVWSVTSYKELYREANDCARWNMLHPTQNAEGAVRHADAEGRTRPVHRGIGLHEGAAGEHCAVGSGQAGIARHGRLRPQRESRVPARLFRSGREAHRAGHAACAGRREARQTTRRCSAKCWRKRSAIWASIRKSATRPAANEPPW